MARIPEPFTVIWRTDSQTGRLTLNPSTSGLPRRICKEWFRRSFKYLPEALGDHRYPKNKTAANAAARAFIAYLKENQIQETLEKKSRRVTLDEMTVGEWIEPFTAIDSSPRADIKINENSTPSIDTYENYESYYRLHIKGDPLLDLKITELEQQDILDFGKRMAKKKMSNGFLMGGTRTFVGVIKFVRMTFNNYQQKNIKWYNPYRGIKEPKYLEKIKDALTEDEIISLFCPGVITDTMEFAVCCALFLSGLRDAEVFAVKHDVLNYHQSEIKVKYAWQCFNRPSKRVLGPTKGKADRVAPFDPIMQEAVKKLIKENGKHEYVFSRKSGRLPSNSWLNDAFRRWLKAAGIDENGRNLTPHTARHSLASMLEKKKVPIRYIQELLGHADPKTTLGYLHSTAETFSDISKTISEAMKGETKPDKDPDNKAMAIVIPFREPKVS